MSEFNSLVQAAGTASSLYVSGAIFTFSFGGVNTVKLATATSPILASQQWLNIYRRCHNIGTPMIIFSAGCFAWLRYQTSNNAYLGAAASCIALVPYTILLLSGPEKVLLPVAKARNKDDVANLSEFEQALKRWEIRNLLRFLFPLLGGLIVLNTKLA